MTRRRRMCSKGHRFSSWEWTRFPFVRKRDDSLAEFNETKLRRAILAAAASLPGEKNDSNAEAFAAETARDIKDRAEAAPERENDAMSTQDIGNRVLASLLQYDETGIAHWRFASVFLKDRGYESVKELSEAIEEEQNRLSLWVVKARSLGTDSRESSETPLTEPFSYNKLRKSLELAFSKTSRHKAIVEGLLDEITKEVRTSAKTVSRPVDANGSPQREHRRLEIDSAKIGEIVLKRIAEDEFAYARFLSVHADYHGDFNAYVNDLVEFAATGPTDE